MTTQKARDRRPITTAPGYLRRSDDHKDPLPIRTFFNEAATAAEDPMLGRTMASLPAVKGLCEADG